MAPTSASQPPADFKGTQRAPDLVARKPHPRHGLASFSRKSVPKEENALVMPRVDLDADMAAINRGAGYFDPATRQVWVHGRLFGMHDNGRTFPVHGDGIIPCDRYAYQALTIIRKYNGVNERSAYEIERNPMVMDHHRDEAIRIWRLREEALHDDKDRGN